MYVDRQKSKTTRGAAQTPTCWNPLNLAMAGWCMERRHTRGLVDIGPHFLHDMSSSHFPEQQTTTEKIAITETRIITGTVASVCSIKSCAELI